MANLTCGPFRAFTSIHPTALVTTPNHHILNLARRCRTTWQLKHLVRFPTVAPHAAPSLSRQGRAQWCRRSRGTPARTSLEATTLPAIVIVSSMSSRRSWFHGLYLVVTTDIALQHRARNWIRPRLCGSGALHGSLFRSRHLTILQRGRPILVTTESGKKRLSKKCVSAVSNTPRAVKTKMIDAFSRHATRPPAQATLHNFTCRLSRSWCKS